MYGLILFLGYVATVALVIILWRRRSPGRSTVPGVLLGLVAGLLWPVTLWVGIGLWWYWPSYPGPRQPQDLDSQAAQARALSEQAETQRVTTAANNPLRRTSTAGIVLVCVFGFVVTLSVLGAIAEEPRPSTDRGATNAADPTSSPTANVSEPEPAGEVVSVARIVDGDTVELSDGRTVRILGIDTPEIHNGTQCWGPEASRFAEENLAGRNVRLVADPTQDAVDPYDRMLGYLVLPEGTNYSVLAAEAGAAFAYTSGEPAQLTPQVTAAEAQARAAGRGVWGPPCFGTKGPPPAPEPAPAPQPAPAPAPAPDEPTSNCEPGYSPCVPAYPPDLNCSDVNGPIIVTGSDPHRLDGDGDGRGCE